MNIPSRSDFGVWSTVAAVAVFSLLSFLHGRVNLRIEESRLGARGPGGVQQPPPSPGTLSWTFLGYDTLACDVAWVGALVYFGNVTARGTKPQYLTEYAETVQQLDPTFRPIYDWYDSTYSNHHHPLRHEEIERINAFLERGMKHFPNDYELPYDAGMNYIGNPTNPPPERELQHFNRAIEYLETASQLEGGPDVLPLTVLWLYDERRRIRAEMKGQKVERKRQLTERQIEFLSEMYFLVTSDKTRNQIERVLGTTSSGREAIARQGRELRQKFRHAHRGRFSYLPVGLWAAITRGET